MHARHAIWLKGGLAKTVRPLGRLIKDTSGASLVLVALALPMVLGMAALGLDATLWYMQKRQMQAVADNAVLAGVLALSQGGSASEIEQAVITHAGYAGFQNGVDGHISVNNPPSAGPNQTDTDYIEVFVERDAPTMLSLFNREGALTIQTRAVGSMVSGGNYCVVALSTDKKHAVDFAGASTATLNSCAIASNSNDAEAVRATGGSLSADAMQAVGGIMYDASVSLTYGPPREGAPAVQDPHADLVVIPTPAPDSFAACDGGTDWSSSGDQTVSPGIYCGGMRINSGDTITFNPGVYLIHDGNFDASAGATLQNAPGPGGVTIIITGEEVTDIGTFKINGSATVNLTAPGPAGHDYAPYIGEYAGILVFVDGRAPNTHKHYFNGGSDMTLEGALYAPSSEIVFNGGANVTVGCLQVIADQVNVSGNSTITSVRDDCGALGVKTAGSHLPRLAE